MNPQDPLAELRDIHLPDAVSWWPPAPGWWILAFLLLAAVAFLVWRKVTHYRANRYRREALATLNAARLDFLKTGSTSIFTTAILQVLKRAAISAFPNVPTQKLNGRTWRGFLATSAGPLSFSNDETSDTEVDRLLNLPYQANISREDAKALYRLALHWLQHHRNTREARQWHPRTGASPRAPEESARAAI